MEIISKVINFIKHIITIVVLILSFISSLFMQPKDNVKTKETLIEKTRIEYINEVGPEIIRCLNEKDKKGLNDLFCEKVRNTEYLKKQIDFFFDYIEHNGELEFRSGKWVDNGGHGSYNYGRTVVDANGWKYDESILIDNKEYTLYCSAYITLVGHKEYEGINNVYLCDIRDLSSATREQRTIAWNDRTVGKYLGIGIFKFNYETYLRENIAPKEIYENEEYRIDTKDLEKK